MNVLVIEDHPLMQEAVVQVVRQLGPDVSVRTARDCESALQWATQQLDIDLVLLDLQLPGLSGLEAVRAWRRQHPAVPLAVLSADDDRRMVRAALREGAAAYVPKSTPHAVMLGAMRIVLDGGRYLPPELLVDDDAPQVPPAARHTGLDAAAKRLGLTARQCDVLALVARGESNKVICRELGLAERTVKCHVSAVLRALGVRTRTQAAVAATRLGFDAMPEASRVRG